VIHPDVAARFPLLDGLTSMREAYGTPEGLERIRAYESWQPAEGPPSVDVRDDAAPGPHGRVPVLLYEPPAGERTGRPCLVWLHGGGFLGGDLDMREADWTAREVCARAGAVVVSVD
jgi:acetyl esterase